MAVDFALNVRQWSEKAKMNLDAATYAVGLAVVERVKELTPVKTGFLRSSWQLVTENQRNSFMLGLQNAASTGASDYAYKRVRDRVGSGLGFLGRFAGPGAGLIASGAIGGATGADTSVEGTIGSTVGSYVLGAIGGAIGSVLAPGIGTAVGYGVGSALGSGVGTVVGEQYAGELAQRLRGTPLEPVAAAFGSTDKLGGVIYILNAAPYARRIEYGFVGEDSLGRRFNYQGAGMMQQTIAELPQIAEKAIADFNG